MLRCYLFFVLYKEGYINLIFFNERKEYFMIAKNKKALSILLALTLLFSMTIAVSARWSHTSSITIGLSFSGSKGTLSYSVLGEPGTTKITGVAILERLNSDGTYKEIERWDYPSINDDYLPWGTHYYVSTGYTYRFTFISTVYRNGDSETVSASKSADA